MKGKSVRQFGISQYDYFFSWCSDSVNVVDINFLLIVSVSNAD